MIYFIVIVLILLILVSTYLTFILREIKSINSQLDYINRNNTNAEITHTSTHNVIQALVHKINLILRSTKLIERTRQKQERDLYQTLASLSHDLRTPLTTAYGYTKLIQNQIETNELVPKIIQSLEETTAYLDYIVDYTSISERQSAMNYETLNISNLLSQQILQYYDSLTQAGIKPELDIQANVYLICDALFMQRIITNLLGNIIKYADTMCSIRLSQHKDDSITLVAFNDSSMTIDNLAQIQQRFITGDTSRANKSVGLGLDIIQKCSTILNGTTDISYHDAIFKVSIHLKNANDHKLYPVSRTHK